MNEIRKLPLWKNALNALIVEGLQHGKEITAEFFEQHLSVKRGTVQYGAGVQAVREELLKRGHYLSGRGHNGAGFTLVAPSNFARIARNKSGVATRNMKRGITLLATTDIRGLNQAEQQDHIATLQKMQTRYALMRRPRTIWQTIERKAPGLLTVKTETTAD